VELVAQHLDRLTKEIASLTAERDHLIKEAGLSLPPGTPMMMPTAVPGGGFVDGEGEMMYRPARPGGAMPTGASYHTPAAPESEQPSTRPASRAK
jgi:hypothetical protein